MTVLSYQSIVARIGNGELVVDGQLDSVGEASYHFSPGRVFQGGSDEVVDWTNPTGGEHFVIKPGRLVWIMPRERVKIPQNVCAFWWQTNSLSRKGLMLVNMSMIDPGYEGPLGCLFVNFGNQPVRIDPKTIIAKLVFHTLDMATEKPLELVADEEKYTSELHQTALEGPSSFLRFNEISSILKEEARKAKETMLGEMKDDAPKYLMKSFGVAAGGLFLLVAAVSFIPTIQSVLSPSLGDLVKQSVEQKLFERMSLDAETQQGNKTENVPVWARNLDNKLNYVLQRMGEPPYQMRR